MNSFFLQIFQELFDFISKINWDFGVASCELHGEVLYLFRKILKNCVYDSIIKLPTSFLQYPVFFQSRTRLTIRFFDLSKNSILKFFQDLENKMLISHILMFQVRFLTCTSFLSHISSQDRQIFFEFCLVHWYFLGA